MRVFDSVAEAIADLNTVFATTARPRETRQPVRTPREASRVLYDDTAAGLKTGLFKQRINRHLDNSPAEYLKMRLFAKNRFSPSC